MKKSKPRKAEDAEYRADAWERFEQAVDVALHTRSTNKAVKKKGRMRSRSSKAKNG